MIPVKFKEQNGSLVGGPSAEYGTGDDVVDLPVYRGSGMVISCWRLTFWERLRLVLTGNVWLLVLGTNHAPVKLTTGAPFEAEERKAAE
jgi:hypothetical protein